MQRYKNDETVYASFFDYDTAKIYSEEYKVLRYDAYDGMQWNVTDNYRLCRYEYKTKFLFFKSVNMIQLSRPGNLIHVDKEVSKVLLLITVLNRFDYVDDSHISNELKNIVQTSKAKYNWFAENYPELIIKAIGVPVLADDNDDNRHFLWR